MSHTPDPKDLKKVVKKATNTTMEDVKSDVQKEAHKVTDAVGDTAKAAGNTIQAAAHHVQDMAQSGLDKIADVARGLTGRFVEGVADVAKDMSDKVEAIKKEVNS